MGIKVDYGSTLGQVEFPDDFSEEQVRQFVLANDQKIRRSLAARAQAPALRDLAASETALENVSRSPLETAARAVGGQIGNLGSFLEAGAEIQDRLAPGTGLIGPRAMETLGLGDFLRSFGVTEELPRQTPTLKDIAQSYEERGLLDAAREAGAFTAGSIVEQSPNIISTLLTGAGLGLAQVPARVAAVAAPLITTFPVEAGGAFEEITSRAPEADRAKAAGVAMGVGALNAALESLSDAPILGGAMKEGTKQVTRGLLRPMGRVAAGALGEGVTEAGQEVTTGMAPELFGAERDPGLGMRIAEAGVAGAVAGAPFSGAAEVQRAVNERRSANELLRQGLTPRPPIPTADQTLLQAQDAQAQVRQQAQVTQSQLASEFAAQSSRIDAAREALVQNGFDPVTANVQAAVSRLNLATQRFARAQQVDSGLAQAEQAIGQTAVDDLLQQNRERLLREAAGIPNANQVQAPVEVLPSPEVTPVQEVAEEGQGQLPQPAGADPQEGLTQVLLGLKRPVAIDPGLELLTDEEFRKARKQADKAVEAAESAYDLGAISDQELADAQDRYSAAEREAFRRDIRGRYVADLFADLLTISDRALDPTSQRGSEALMLMDEIVRQGASLEELLSELDSTNPDKAEVLRGQFEDLKRVMLNRAKPRSIGAQEVALANLLAQRQDQFGAAARPTAPQAFLTPEVEAQLRAARQADATANLIPQIRRPDAGLFEAVQGDEPSPVDEAILSGQLQRQPQIIGQVKPVEQMTPHEAAGYKLPRGRGADVLPGMDMMAGRPTPIRSRASDEAGTLDHAIEVATAIRLGRPVSAIAVDSYEIALPSGWTRQGDLYVPPGQSPQPETAPTPPADLASKVRSLAPKAKKPTTGGRKKLGSEGKQTKRQARWAEVAAESLSNLSPEETAQIEWDRRPEGARPATAETNKTRFVRFADLLDNVVRSHPITRSILQTAEPEIARVKDALLGIAARDFVDAEANGQEFRLDFALAEAKRNIRREVWNITRTKRWQNRVKTVSTTVETDDGTETLDIADEQDEDAEPIPKEQEPVNIDETPAMEEARRREELYGGGLTRMAEAVQAFVDEEGVDNPTVVRALFYKLANRIGGQAALANLPEGAGKKGVVYDAAFNPKSPLYKEIDEAFERMWDAISSTFHSLVSQIKVSIGSQQVQDAVQQALGFIPGSLEIIDDPDHVAPNGQRFAAGYIVKSTGKVVLNAAFIESREKAVEVLLEEYGHMVWDDPAIQADWDRVKAEVTQADLAEMEALGYSKERALEEAAIRKTIAYLKENRPVASSIETFLSNLWETLKSLLGIGSQYDQSRNAILRRVLEAAKVSPAPNQDAAYMALAERFNAGDESVRSELERMVEQAAKKAGYNVGPVYHGTSAQFTVFTPSKVGNFGPGVYVAFDEAEAKRYADRSKGNRIIKGYARITNPIVGRDANEASEKLFSMFPAGNDQQVIANAIARGYDAVVAEGALSTVFGGSGPQASLFSSSQIKSADPVTYADDGSIIPLSRRFDPTTNDIRTSLAQGLFVSPSDFRLTATKAQEVGGSTQSIADIAQVQGELIPRTTVSSVEALAKSDDSVASYAGQALTPILKYGQLPDAAMYFGPTSPTARLVYDLPEDTSRELAARAVVRTHLALDLHRSRLVTKLEKAKVDLESAVADLPKAAEAEMEKAIAETEGKEFVEAIERDLANRITTASAADVVDAQAVAQVKDAAAKISEAKRSITPAIGNALRAIVRELPPQITSNAAILTWLQARLADKSLPQLMGEATLNFLITPLHGARTAPIQKVDLAKLVADLRSLELARETARKEMEDFRAARKKKRITFQGAAKEYVGIREKYRAALETARKINDRVRSTATRVAGLEKAVQIMDDMRMSFGYRTKLQAAIDVSNTLDSAIKLTTGTRGKTGVSIDGTLSVVDPMTRKQVILSLTPTAEKYTESMEKLQGLISSMKAFIALSESEYVDPIELARVKKDVARLESMVGVAKPLQVSLFPSWIPIIGDLTIPSVWTLRNKFPWFGKRLSAPNNIIAWVGGLAGRELPVMMQARDVVARMLEGLRSDPNPKNASQRSVDLATITAMKAHGLDPANAAQQDLIQRHSSRILSQYQAPGSVPYKVGDWNSFSDMEVLPEDIALAQEQKRLEDAIQSILKKASGKGLTRSIERLGIGIEETVFGRSISRRSANYGLKMARRPDRQAVPVIDEWAKAGKEKKIELMQANFATLVLGIALETDPTFSLKPDALDRQAFNKLVQMERENRLPFSDFNGFIQWIANERASETDLTEAEEIDAAIARFSGYIDTLTSKYGVDAAANARGVDDAEMLNAKRNLPPPIVQAMTADNQFVRPRGALNGPSTWYMYDLIGATSQETYKNGLVNLLSAIELAGWMNLRKALQQAMDKWDQKKQQLVAGGMGVVDATRKLNRESRKRSDEVPYEADYATVKEQIDTVDAAIAELQRASQEYIATPADTGFARTGSNLLQLTGSQLLSSPGSIINNTTGIVSMTAMVTGWLGRLSMVAAGSKVIGGMVKTATGRALQVAGEKIPWFGKWLKANGPVVDALNELIAYSAERRQRAVNGLILDLPDVRSQVKMVTSSPGTYGVLDPRRETGMIEWALNMLQAGFGLPKILSMLPKSTPASVRKAVEAIAAAPSYTLEQFKRLFPGSIDRLGNMVAAPIFNATFNDIGFKKRVWDIMERRERTIPGWDDPASPNYQVMDEEFEGVLDPTGIKLTRDILAPMGSFEEFMVRWYKSTPKGKVAENPFFEEEDEQAVAFEFLKLTNLRTESTTPQVSKGKGLVGFWRKMLFQFGRYGANMVGVMERRFAKVAGNTDDENKLLAGLSLAMLILLSAIVGLEVKGFIRDYIENEPRTAPTLTAATTDPTLASRYVAASLASQLPYYGDQLQKMFGGTQPSSPFDLANSTPLLGVGTRAYQAMTAAAQTGDPVYPTVDLLRSLIPMSKPVLNRVMPGETMRREALRAVRASAPGTMELRSGGGGTGRGSPFQPILRDTINAYLEGDMAGYNQGVERAVQYQISTGKTREEATRSVKQALASRDPLTSALGRSATESDEREIVRRLTPRQRNAFLRSRSLAKGLSAGRRTKRANPFRQRRKKAKRRTRL